MIVVAILAMIATMTTATVQFMQQSLFLVHLYYCCCCCGGGGGGGGGGEEEEEEVVVVVHAGFLYVDLGTSWSIRYLLRLSLVVVVYDQS